MSDKPETVATDCYTTRCDWCGKDLPMVRRMLECRVCYDCQQWETMVLPWLVIAVFAAIVGVAFVVTCLFV